MNGEMIFRKMTGVNSMTKAIFAEEGERNSPILGFFYRFVAKTRPQLFGGVTGISVAETSSLEKAQHFFVKRLPGKMAPARGPGEACCEGLLLVIERLERFLNEFCGDAFLAKFLPQGPSSARAKLLAIIDPPFYEGPIIDIAQPDELRHDGGAGLGREIRSCEQGFDFVLRAGAIGEITDGPVVSFGFGIKGSQLDDLFIAEALADFEPCRFDLG